MEITQEQLAELSKSIATSVMEETSKLVDTKLQEKGLSLEKKIFGGVEEAKKLEGNDRVVKFLQAIGRGDEAMATALGSQKAMTEGTTTAGGFFVPDEFSSEVTRLAENFGLIRQLARWIPMQRDVLRLPKVTASVSVSWPGEGVAGTASQPTLAQIVLTAKTMVGITPLTNELLADANIDTIGYLVELFAEAIAGEEDNQGLMGSGSPFTGVMIDSGVNVVTQATGDTTFAKITGDYLRSMIGSLKPLALQGAVFVMHRTIWSTVQTLKGTDGQYIASLANPIISKDATAGVGIVGYVWGYPVYLSEKMPSSTALSTKYVIFGNLKYLFCGDRQQMTLKTTEEATIASTNMFESNMSAVRVTERIAMAVALPTAFVALKTSAS